MRAPDDTKRKLTIFHKLAGLITIVSVVIVAGLAVYFPVRQLDTVRHDLQDKALTYGAQLSAQLRSAVAFDDRETAREVLSGMGSDPDMIGQAVYVENGRLLEAIGEHDAVVPAVDEPRLESRGDRITVMTPIASLEGPRGTAVIHISTARIDLARSSIIRSAAVAGGIALALGILAAWLIARSIGRRLQDISGAAGRVAAGDLSDAQFEHGSGDEIGALATSFTMMVQQIRELMASRDEQARLEQARLGTLVANRTAKLAKRNRELSFVLDNVDQGLFIVDLAGRISRQRSAAVERLLGPVPADRLLASYVNQFAREEAAWFDVCWASIRDGLLPDDLALSQMPSQFVVGGKHLELSYQIVDDGSAKQVLIVVTDVSARIERERAERDQQEIAGLVMRLLSDRAGFLELHAEMEQRCSAMERNRLTDLAALRRDAHTVKGTAASAGIVSISTACHELEDRLDDHDSATTTAAIERVVQRWRDLASRLAPFTSSRLDRIEVSEDELDDLLSALRRLPGTHAIARVVDSWRDEPVRARLERLAGHARTLSEKLGKGPVAIEIEADHTRIAADRWAAFWGSLVHVVRNAVDHGLETPEERVAAGKSPGAKLVLRATSREGDLVLQIEDEGRGIDWSRVARAARNAGLPTATHQDLVEALFADGLTTRSAVTATSGRGVGLAAVHQACREVGGDVRVDSRLGLGTCFTFMLPAHPQAQLAARRAAGDLR